MTRDLLGVQCRHDVKVEIVIEIDVFKDGQDVLRLGVGVTGMFKVRQDVLRFEVNVIDDVINEAEVHHPRQTLVTSVLMQQRSRCN